MTKPHTRLAVALAAACALSASSLSAETVNLPYQVSDNNGNQWVVYYQGNLQMQGNQPVFAQAGMISVNGRTPRQQNQQAKIDEKTREVILEFRDSGSVSHQRRFKFDDATGIVRIVDVFDNRSDKNEQLNLNLNTNTNYGVQNASVLDDPKKNGQIGWVADTHANRTALSLWGGKGSKVLPTINYNQGNNSVNAILPLEVPGKGRVAMVQWHGSFDSTDAATQWVEKLRETRELADLPSDIKKAIVNVRGLSSGSVAGIDLLRGDTSDIIELRGGDQIRGELKVQTYKLNTAFGSIELPASRVASLLNVGDFRQRQLLVSAEGEIFGGELAEQNVPILLTSGQTTQVPLSQISRIGYRTGGAEQPEWTFTKPMVFLRSGERCFIAPPETPIEFVTRYGALTFQPQQISTINIKTEGNAHEIYLTDGSRLSGIVLKPQIGLKLVSASGEDKVAFPLPALARVQFAPLSEDVGAGKPTLGLQGGDIVCTRLQGELQLITTFDTLKIDAAQVRTIARPDEGLADVQVTLFDQSTFRGTLATPVISAKLAGGLSIDVPVAAMRDYDNPMPFPSESIVAKVKDAISKLNDDDWKEREAAELTLINFGPTIIGVLEESREGQPTEVQQRLAGVIKRLGKDAPAVESRLSLPPPLE